MSGSRFRGSRALASLDTPFADIFQRELTKHRAEAHKFVDELFDKEGGDDDVNKWRRLLSAMMEDFQRWQVRDKTKPFLPRMSIPLDDMTED